MQMIRTLICAAALAAGQAAKAPRSLRAKAAAVGALSKKEGQALVAAPVLEVAVPVMVVVEDEGTVGRSDPASGLGNLSSKCRFELTTISSQMNQTETAQVESCENEGNYTGRAIEALQEANSTRARTLVEETFSKCARMSQACAEEMAPDVVMKARFSGMAVSNTCIQVAQSLDPGAGQAQAQTQCMKDSTKAQAEQLERQDMEQAVLAAQHGLSNCSKVEAPCDFQLAPMLITQLVQATLQQQMRQMLDKGLRQAAEVQKRLQEELAKAEAKHAATTLSSKAIGAGARPATPAKKAAKKLSLLSLAQGTHISSAPQAVMF